MDTEVLELLKTAISSGSSLGGWWIAYKFFVDITSFISFCALMYTIWRLGKYWIDMFKE